MALGTDRVIPALQRFPHVVQGRKFTWLLLLNPIALVQGKDAAVVSGRVQNSSRLMGILQDFGDNSLLLAGMHEFMESSGFSDISMRQTAAMQGHLQDADIFARACMRTGDYGLQKYIPSSIIALATMLAVPHR